MKVWLSEKGIKYILNPKRGAWCLINPDISSAIMAKGMQQWNGTFISESCEYVERKDGVTKIVDIGGKVLYYDGDDFYED